jgi:hypothetical protein
VEQAPAARAERVDLMQALEASLQAARSRGDRTKVLEQAADRLTEETRQAQGDDDAQSENVRSSGAAKRSSAPKAKARKRPSQGAPGKAVRSAAQDGLVSQERLSPSRPTRRRLLRVVERSSAR